MSAVPHLEVTVGPDKGKQFTVPSDGARLGRSSKNDLVLVDPLLSRHHCRLFFKSDGILWVTDLGSANLTLVNGKPIQEVMLQPGDVVTVGDTSIRVASNRMDGEPPTGGAPVPPAPPPAAAGSRPIDLGLGKPGTPAPTAKPHNILFLLLLAALSTAFALAVWYPKIKQRRQPAPAERPAAAQPSLPDALEIAYESVIASTQNIFRYSLTLTPDRILRVQMDDLENDRHLSKDKTVDADYLAELTRTLKQPGFFALAPDYRGLPRNDVYEQRDLMLTIGARTHRCRVINRVEPDEFKSVRESIEAFGKNELGLWATQFPVEKLREMAETAWLQGRKLYDERAVQPGNLAAAIRSIREADLYLESVDPKPDYYAEMLTRLSDCEQELQQSYEQASFNADRSIRLREWDAAARELRRICDMVPERSDARHAEARKKLLDVERRMEKKP